MSDTFVWSERNFVELIKRFYSRREIVEPKARPGYIARGYSFELPLEDFLGSGLLGVETLNGYQLAFYTLSQLLADLAQDHAIVFSYHLRLQWPVHRNDEDLELFCQGVGDISEQLGFLFGSAEAVLGHEYSLHVEVRALQNEIFQPPPEIAEGDLLWLLVAPGEAAAGSALLLRGEASSNINDIDEEYRERLIQAALQAPPLLLVARTLRMAGIAVGTQSMKGGLNQALLDLIPPGLEFKASHPMPGSRSLERTARLLGSDATQWIYDTPEMQLLWRSPTVLYDAARALLWNRFELETLEIGRLVAVSM